MPNFDLVARMVNDNYILSLRLSSLPSLTRELLSRSLNSEKIIPCDGPDRLPRDWRGLAFQVSLSSRYEPYIRQTCVDKTAEVLSMWQQTNSSATVQYLLRCLEYIDRYDVAEDVFNDLNRAISCGEISGCTGNTQNGIVSTNSTCLSTEPDTELITDDDRPGYFQIYDAMVLYDDNDATFVQTLMQRMTDAGYQICTVDRLQAGHTTQHAPMSRLISERCRRVVLVLSPSFFANPALIYYTDYAAADGIQTQQRKLLPILYRECKLPPHLSHYHKLFYESVLYDFWQKLFQSLEMARMSSARPLPRPIAPAQRTSPPQIAIEEYPTGKMLDYLDSQDLFLQRNDLSISMPRLDTPTFTPISRTENCHSISNVDISEDQQIKKKKKNYLRKFFSTLKGKKTKIM